MASKVKTQPAHKYEFGGPIGAAGITFGLPILLNLFAFACNDISGCPAPSLLNPKNLSIERLKTEVGWPAEGIWGARKLGGYRLDPGLLLPIPRATRLRDYIKPSTDILQPGFSSSMFTLVACLAGTIAQGAEFPVWTFIADNFVQLLTANILISYALAIFVYVRSFSVKAGNKEQRELAAGGHTGNLIYDFYIGRELNPRVTLPLIGEVDIKEFCELRPGLLGWILMNCAFVAKQYRNYGYVTDSIVFITVVQALYVLDGQYMEPAVLTTMDITTDGFGFMLAFGDLSWVPFMYSTQTRYLATYPLSMGWVGTAAVSVVLAAGLAIFRLSNSQKNMFRTDPNDYRVAHIRYIETKTGTRLMTSGWWGIARHINYFGDWLQSWPYSLPTGFSGYIVLNAGSAVPGAITMLDGREVVQGPAKYWGMIFTYFYILYFAVLLIHRDGRDDEKCARKYGEDWEKYKSIVKYKIVPGIY
ncbi:hypothetical protein PG989_007700 [Apiospora arundinis]